MKRLCLFVLFASCASLVAQAPEAGKKAKKAGLAKPLAIEDILQSESARGFQFAPDGKRLAWVKRGPDKEKNEYVDHLVLTFLDSQQDIALTRGEHSCTSPRWSPNGKKIAFLSGRPAPKTKDAPEEDSDEKDDPRTKLWLIDSRGGEPWLLANFPRDIRDHAWLDDDTLVFAAQEKKAAFEKERKEKKDEAQTIDDEANEPPVRLFKIDVTEKKVLRITHNTDRIQALFVSPNGRYAVTIHERSLRYNFDHKIKPAVFLHDLEMGTNRQIFQDLKFNLTRVVWRPDSKGLFAVSQYTTDPQFLNAFITELYWFDPAKEAPVRVDLDWDKGLANDDVAPTKDGFVVLLADGVRHRPARFAFDGTSAKRQLLSGEHTSNIYEFFCNKDGSRIVYLYSKASGPNQWYVARLEKERIVGAKKLFALEPNWAEKKLAKTEIIHWPEALDEEIDGILYYPLTYEMGKSYPLVVQLHGGPAWADFDVLDENWAYPPNLYTGRGAFVLQVNYHGSTHYGLKFAESISAGKYYDLPVVDIEKGIDFLVAKGLVDAKRVALAGWSNGAILTMALITRRHYAAAAAGAGGSEWVADWGVCTFGMSFSNYYLGKSPYDDPKLYFKNAPFYDFPKVRTPTIFFHGAEDRDVPTHHSWLQFRALQQLGKTDVRFILFPGEKHSLKKLAHHKRKLTEELAWFDKHLFQTAPKLDFPAYKPTSPLAGLLLRQQAKKQGKQFGDVHQGTLIPEVVKHESLLLGRFEVTRAQYAEFDKSYRIEPGTDNFPANGITFEQAKAYCLWLSKITENVYRLGTLEEMEDVIDSVENSENTLDYWAGYSINPDDRERILPKIRELAGPAPLLREVGSFASLSKEAPIFDLGGNVAEWVVTEKGGKAIGGSADRSADDKERPPAPEYVGFRVVREKGK